MRGIHRLALIIGAMKAGTTSLFEYIGAHPAVAPCRTKEPDFFADPDRARAGLDAYAALWSLDPDRHRVALEASTSYTMRPAVEGVPGRVAALAGPEPRFLYLLRDPIDRVASHLSHLATRRGGADRVGEDDFLAAIHVSRYAAQLEPWAALWPRERFLLLRHEALVADPGAVTARALRFLDLPSAAEGDPALGAAHNTRDAIAADQVLADVLVRAPWLGPLRRWVPDPLWRKVRAGIGARTSHTVRLGPQRREAARRALADDVRRLREEWGVDVSGWSVSP